MENNDGEKNLDSKFLNLGNYPEKLEIFKSEQGYYNFRINGLMTDEMKKYLSENGYRWSLYKKIYYPAKPESKLNNEAFMKEFIKKFFSDNDNSLSNNNKNQPISNYKIQTSEDYIGRISKMYFDAIQKDLAPWMKPWKGSEHQYDFNPSTMGSNESYKGKNILHLQLSRIFNNYNDPRWVAYGYIENENENLAKNNERMLLKKGSLGTIVEYWDQRYYLKKEESYNTNLKKAIFRSDYYKLSSMNKDKYKSGELVMNPKTVFNVSDLIIVKLDENKKVIKDENGEYISRPAFEEFKAAIVNENFTENGIVEDFVKKTGAKVFHDNLNQNYYINTHNEAYANIHLTNKESFKTEEDYYSTLLHELTHWTGHKTRCNREEHKLSYAQEELVAEIGSYLIAKELGVSFTPDEQNFSYVKAWCADESIKDKSQAIYQSVKFAVEAKNYLTNLVNVNSKMKTKENVCQNQVTYTNKGRKI